MPTLSELIQQRAFLEAGGGEPTDLEKINALFGNIATTGLNISKMRALAAERDKTEVEARKIQSGLRPIERTLNLPAPAESEAAFKLRQAKRGKIEFTSEDQNELDKLEDFLKSNRDIVQQTGVEVNPQIINKLNFLRGKKTLSEQQGVSPQERETLEAQREFRRQELARFGLPETAGGTPTSEIPLLATAIQKVMPKKEDYRTLPAIGSGSTESEVRSL